MNRLDEALQVLEAEKAKAPSVLVSYSGGKESRVILDLSVRVFGAANVKCFFMYFLPGLSCVEPGLAWARQRFGVEVIELPHWILAKCLRGGVYRPVNVKLEELPEIGLYDVWAVARKKTGIERVVMGAKRADSRFRRQTFYQIPQHGGVAPLEHWTKNDVLAYCKLRSIPTPATSAGNATGVDLSTPSLLFLHDTYPQDFARVEEVFPFVRAVVKRREWHGVS